MIDRCGIKELIDMHNIKCDQEELINLVNGSNYLKKRYVDKKSLILQNGGDVVYYDYKIKIKFYVTKDEQGTTYTLHSNNSDSINEYVCLMIIIPKENDPDLDMAEIRSIKNEGKCISEEGIFNLNGTQMLHIAIAFIKAVNSGRKKKLKKIIVTDDAHKICTDENSGKKSNLKLSILNTLLYGHTWYGKYGFRPDPKDNKDTAKIKYDNNTKIYETKKVKDIKNINVYVRDYAKNIKKESAGSNDFKFIEYILNGKLDSYSISDFIRGLMKYNCCDLLAHIYINIFKDLGFEDIANTNSFYLNI